MRTYKPHARVAHQNPRRIDEVDGVPATHTERGWHHAWTIGDDPDHAPPLPFGDKKGVPAVVAVPLMCSAVLIGSTASVVIVLDGHAQALLIAFGCTGLLALWAIILTLPALLRSRR